MNRRAIKNNSSASMVEDSYKTTLEPLVSKLIQSKISCQRVYSRMHSMNLTQSVRLPELKTVRNSSLERSIVDIQESVSLPNLYRNLVIEPQIETKRKRVRLSNESFSAQKQVIIAKMHPNIRFYKQVLIGLEKRMITQQMIIEGDLITIQEEERVDFSERLPPELRFQAPQQQLQVSFKALPKRAKVTIINAQENERFSDYTLRIETQDIHSRFKFEITLSNQIQTEFEQMSQTQILKAYKEKLAWQRVKIQECKPQPQAAYKVIPPHVECVNIQPRSQIQLQDEIIYNISVTFQLVQFNYPQPLYLIRRLNCQLESEQFKPELAQMNSRQQIKLRDLPFLKFQVYFERPKIDVESDFSSDTMPFTLEAELASLVAQSSESYQQQPINFLNQFNNINFTQMKATQQTASNIQLSKPSESSKLELSIQEQKPDIQAQSETNFSVKIQIREDEILVPQNFGSVLKLSRLNSLRSRTDSVPLPQWKITQHAQELALQHKQQFKRDKLQQQLDPHMTYIAELLFTPKTDPSYKCSPFAQLIQPHLDGDSKFVQINENGSLQERTENMIVESQFNIKAAKALEVEQKALANKHIGAIENAILAEEVFQQQIEAVDYRELQDLYYKMIKYFRDNYFIMHLDSAMAAEFSKQKIAEMLIKSVQTQDVMAEKLQSGPIDFQEKQEIQFNIMAETAFQAEVRLQLIDSQDFAKIETAYSKYMKQTK
ncbi:Hypothetical_protein [Hexamita inflata]|uniref:Hypothetical_protein n=1 Tax=Hexamita inflata TaxID=28002 RepID=A0AA86RB42_9EUKA|nr:Hypothetical protein HINF_LOCUS61805 [Hexamita inflata]